VNQFEFFLLGRRIFGKASTGVESLLRRLFDFPAQALALESSWNIEVQQVNVPPPPLENPYTVAIHAGRLEVSSSQNRVLLCQEDATVQLEFGDVGTLLTLFGTSSHLYPCLMTATIEAMRVSGLLPMHTAIAARGGVGIAFTGESGRGKTTTLLHSMRAGYSPVCEDFAWLEPQSLTVFGTDRGLRCLPDTLVRMQQFFPDAHPVAFEVDKHLVPFEALAPRVWRCRLQQVWTLERNLQLPTHLEPLGKAQAVMALYGCFGVPLSGLARNQILAAMGDLIGRLEVQQLQIGSTPLPFHDKSLVIMPQ
jgi:hypothetical protein